MKYHIVQIVLCILQTTYNVLTYSKGPGNAPFLVFVHFTANDEMIALAIVIVLCSISWLYSWSVVTAINSLVDTQ
jgi:hypothetical protein